MAGDAITRGCYRHQRPLWRQASGRNRSFLVVQQVFLPAFMESQRTGIYPGSHVDIKAWLAVVLDRRDLVCIDVKGETNPATVVTSAPPCAINRNVTATEMVSSLPPARSVAISSDIQVVPAFECQSAIQADGD